MVKLKQHERLVINESVSNELIKYYHKGVHENKEFCGILVGQLGIVNELIEIPNIATLPLYEFDPIAFHNALNTLDATNKELLAIFHTHGPNSFELSQIDIDSAELNVVYIVVSSTMEAEDEFPKVDFKGWLIKDKKPVEIKIVAPLKKLETGDKAQGLEIKISGDGLNSFVSMIEAYTGANRIRRENSRLRHDIRRLRNRVSNLEGTQSGGAGRLGGIHNPVISDNLFGDDDFDDPDDPDLMINQLEPLTVTENPKPKVQEHTHQYKWANKTLDDKNVYECEFPDCNAVLTVDGEIEPKEDDNNLPAVPTETSEKIICPECNTEFETTDMVAEYKCPKCGKLFTFDETKSFKKGLKEVKKDGQNSNGKNPDTETG